MFYFINMHCIYENISSTIFEYTVDRNHDTSGTGAVVIQDELGIKHAALYLALIGLNKVKYIYWICNLYKEYPMWK